MAFTYTKKIRDKIGSKEFRVYEITPDGSATTIDAGNLDLNYIDYCIPSLKDVLTAVAAHAYISGSASGTYVTLGAAHTASETIVVQAWGW